MKSYLFFSAAVLASAGAWLGPLVLVDRSGSWWSLGWYLLSVPACEACWWAHDRFGPAG